MESKGSIFAFEMQQHDYGKRHMFFCFCLIPGVDLLLLCIYTQAKPKSYFY